MGKILFHNQCGVALLMALLVVSFLVTMTMQLTVDVDAQIEDASGAKQLVQLESIMHTGLSVAQAALYSDQKRNTYDSFHDSWASLDQDLLHELAGDGELAIEVKDVSGMLQVHALVAKKTSTPNGSEKQNQPDPQEQQEKLERTTQLWKRFLLSGKFAIEDEQQVNELLDAIRDWIDEDDDPRDNGAENAYYQSVDPQYRCANSRLKTKEELLYVKGMSRQLFYGDDEHEGLEPYLTVVGDDGKINVNTAAPQVLLALSPDLTEEMVEDLIAYRGNEDHEEELANPQWYQGVDGFPGDITLDEQLITTQSAAFQVTIRGQLGKMKRTGCGILVRHETKEQTLQHWHVK
ncbi:MAG: hypothetical protein CSB34_05330 [Desulfobulbus propionicus]|nr:MAG: hypothetical protein CSB34_05330 [Desulfobulbus propionicus]